MMPNYFLKFSPAVVAGEKYQLKMDVRSDVAASYSTQAHVTAGAYKHWDFFGTISSTPTWSTYTKEITVSADMATSGAIAFNLGKTATTFYFDNITLKKYNEKGSPLTQLAFRINIPVVIVGHALTESEPDPRAFICVL